MRAPEATWIREALAALGPEAASPVLHLGSQTAEFRAIKKPHIDRNLFGPLAAAGFHVVHADIVAADGVDMVGDVFDPDFIARLRAIGFRSLICANLLEHVRDPRAIAAACVGIVGNGGHIVATMPYSYPYHADPIDTMLRPDPAGLAALFPRTRIVEARVIADGSLTDEIRASREGFARYALKAAYRIVSGLWRPRIARAQLHRLTWLARPFTVSCALMKVE